MEGEGRDQDGGEGPGGRSQEGGARREGGAKRKGPGGRGQEDSRPVLTLRHWCLISLASNL